MVSLVLLVTLSADLKDVDTRLDAGEIIITTEAVENSTIPKAKMQGVIDAPPEKIWAIIEQCGNYSKTMPRVAASKELSRDGGSVVCEVTVQTPFPLPNLTSQTDVVMTVEPGVRWSRKWKLIKGDYNYNDGSWLLVPFKGDPKRTLATYEVHADPKIAVPQGIINSAQSRSLPKMLEGLREQTAPK